MKSQRSDESTRAPRVSVVLPTYNRPTSLHACLASLAAQDFPRDDYEVIVVDDGSRESLTTVVDQFVGTMSVRLLQQRNAGPASARNAGAAAARGALLAFIDDDCAATPHWISTLVRHASEYEHAAIGGFVENALRRNAYASASQLLVDYLYGYYDHDEVQGRFFVTSNVAFPKDAFLALGGFDTSFPLAAAEDRELCERWREAGYPLHFASDAVVQHAHRLTFRRFCRQHFTYGRGAHYLQLARAQRGQHRLRIEPMQFYSKMLMYPFVRLPFPDALGSAMLLAVSQIMYVAGYTRERWG